MIASIDAKTQANKTFLKAKNVKERQSEEKVTVGWSRANSPCNSADSLTTARREERHWQTLSH